MRVIHRMKLLSLLCVVLAIFGCATVQTESNIASQFLADELEYYETNADRIDGGGFIVGVLMFGTSFPEFEDDLQYALSRTPVNAPWLAMISFEANSQTYSIHHWHSFLDKDGWRGIAIPSFGEASFDFVDLDTTKIDRFMDGVRAENCVDLSREDILHGRVYFITLNTSSGSLRRFAIKEPDTEKLSATESITYQDLGKESDGSKKSGTITYQSDWEKGECYDTLSEYVDLVESAFSFTNQSGF